MAKKRNRKSPTEQSDSPVNSQRHQDAAVDTQTAGNLAKTPDIKPDAPSVKENTSSKKKKKGKDASGSVLVKLPTTAPADVITQFPMSTPLNQYLLSIPTVSTSFSHKEAVKGDPSLSYYENPFKAPVVAEACTFFQGLHKGALAFPADIPQSEIDANTECVPGTHSPLIASPYNAEHHFAMCSTCRKARRLSHDQIMKLKDESTPRGKPQQQQHESSKVESPSQAADPKFPFYVVLDDKTTWRTHAKIAVRPCSDHNHQLEMNLNQLKNDDLLRKAEQGDKKIDSSGEAPDGGDKDGNQSDAEDDSADDDLRFTPQDLAQVRERQAALKTTNKKEKSSYGLKKTSRNAFLYRNINRCNCGQTHMGIFHTGTHLIPTYSNVTKQKSLGAGAKKSPPASDDNLKYPLISSTPSHHPLLNHALRLIHQGITACQTPAFSDVDGSGCLRHIVVSVPSTLSNNLYLQWHTETLGGANNEWRARMKKRQEKGGQDQGGNKPLERIPYPQVQLALVWNENLNDSLKKQRKLVEIPPLISMPYPFAFDQFKAYMNEPHAPGPKPSGPKKSQQQKTKNDDNEETDVSAHHTKDGKQAVEDVGKPPKNVMGKGKDKQVQSHTIPYARERRESYKALYELLKSLLVQFKAVPKAFIEWCQYRGYEVEAQTTWSRDIHQAFNDAHTAQASSDHSADQMDDDEKDDQSTGLASKTSSLEPESALPECLKANYTPITATTVIPSTKLHPSSSSSSPGASTNPKPTASGSLSHSTDNDSTNKGKQTLDQSKLMDFPLPLCSHCHFSFNLATNNHTEKEKRVEYFNNCMFTTLDLNGRRQIMNSPTCPNLDLLNAQQGLLWGSVWVHYNNAWSHSNGVYSNHIDAWQHVFGQHSITEQLIEDKQLHNFVTDYSTTLRLAKEVAIAQTNASQPEEKKKPQPNTRKVFTDDSKADNHDKTTCNKAKAASHRSKALQLYDQQVNKKSNVPKIIPTFAYPPTVFRQGNIKGFIHLLQHLLMLLPSSSKHLVELHSGTGTISLHTLNYTSLLTVSDVNFNNQHTFHRSVANIHHFIRGLSRSTPDGDTSSNQLQSGDDAKRLNDFKLKTTILPYLAMSSDQLVLQEIPYCDVIIMDPPRKGLDETTLEKLCLSYYRMDSDSHDKKRIGPGSSTVFPFDIVDDHEGSEHNGDGQDANISKLRNKNKRDIKKWTNTYKMLNKTIQQSGLSNFSSTQQTSTTPGGGRSRENTVVAAPSIPWMRTAKVLIYVSCGFPAFQRDCMRLLAADWRLAHAHGHSMF